MGENPILIIDDDLEDLELISEAFRELQVPNELVCFNVAEEALQYLKTNSQQPLFILCDINMNNIDGFELRQIIYDDERLRLKSVPFLFLSTQGNRPGITKAYELAVQGYFIKPSSFDEIVKLMRCIIQYWGYSQNPNTRGLREN